MDKIPLILSTGLFGLAFSLALASRPRALAQSTRSPWPAWLTRLTPLALVAACGGILAGLVYIFFRYYRAWPMTPMFMGSVAAPPFLAVFGLISFWKAKEPEKKAGLIWVFGLAFLLGLLSLVFPKDFYLPFLKTASLYSQAHLAFNFLGKAAFLLAAARAFLALRADSPDWAPTRFWLAVGFALWTLSMLTGEIWSYLGWGLPVVWDDAVIVCFMATWFYYVAVLHQFLVARRQKAWLYLAAAGGLWVLAVNVVPDLGPARFPKFW
jgi:hypothetical protein